MDQNKISYKFMNRKEKLRKNPPNKKKKAKGKKKIPLQNKNAMYLYGSSCCHTYHA